MMHFTKGNVLDADVEALVNTVNTVGVMGKGIALMFKEAFPENFREYEAACKRAEVKIGSIFVTELPTKLTGGPRWILNFPTKQHWRYKTRIEWVEDGLRDLRRVIEEKGIRSVAVPPLGCGNGGLHWSDVRPLIERALGDLDGVEVQVYEPTTRYQNVAKRKGLDKLTPARALVAELVRRYWVLGIECSLLEVQKLTYFLDRVITASAIEDPLRLHSGDTIWFDESKKDRLAAYLKSEGKDYLSALEKTSELIDGFESPLGMELLATVDWLLVHEGCEPTLDAIREGLNRWPDNAGERKQRIFDDRMLGIALDRLTATI